MHGNSVFYHSNLTYHRPFEEVGEEVLDLIQGPERLIICGPTNDMICLDIYPEDINLFDLHDHFWVEKLNDQRILVPEPIGFRRIYYDFSGKECKSRQHTALEDANCIMAIFKEFINGEITSRINIVCYSYYLLPEPPK